MSMLTRIFVVLLVVFSLLLSAATITFVSSVDDFTRDNTSLRTRASQLETQLSQKEADTQAIIAAKDKELAGLNDAITKANATIKGFQAQVATSGAELAKTSSSLSISEANVSKLTSALSASEGTKALALQQVTDLRGTLDKLQSQLGDLNVAYNDTVNKLDVTEAARRNFAEQLSDLKGQLDKASAALRDRGVDPNRITTSGVLAGAPPINGVIRETRILSGVPHATISIGSEDAVTVGMEFKILDRASGKFLGTLTVIAVEPNLAIGRLAGPDVASITTGAEVRTQL